MNIKDALKSTGKAETGLSDSCFVQLNNSGVLYWHCKVAKIGKRPVEFEYISDEIWQPYYEDDAKKIVPENVGELWKDDEGTYFHTEECDDGSLTLVCKKYGMTLLNIIHNKHGWTRLYPPVEESMKEYTDRILKNMDGEEVFPFYVKITGCSGDNYWYKNKIGNYYKVNRIEKSTLIYDGFSIPKQYEVDDGISLIRLDDCVIVELHEK